MPRWIFRRRAPRINLMEEKWTWAQFMIFFYLYVLSVAPRIKFVTAPDIANTDQKQYSTGKLNIFDQENQVFNWEKLFLLIWTLFSCPAKSFSPYLSKTLFSMLLLKGCDQ